MQIKDTVKAYCVILFWLPRKWGVHRTLSLKCLFHSQQSSGINCAMIVLVMNYFQADSAKPCCWHWWFLTIKTCNKYSSIWKDIPGQITHNLAKPTVNSCCTIWQKHLQLECSWKERQHCTGIVTMDWAEFFWVSNSDLSRFYHCTAWLHNFFI